MNNNQDPRRFDNGYDPLGQPQVKRTYTPEEAGHDKHRKPVSRLSYNRRRRQRPKLNAAAVIITLIFILITGLCIFLIASGLNRPSDNKNDDPGKSPVPDETTEAVTTEDPLPYFTAELTKDQISYGELILVNSYNEYLFPEEMEGDVVNISEYKNEYYGMSSYSTSVKASKVALDAFNRLTEDCYNETGFKYLQINSCYRSREEQETLYAQYVEERGEEYAKAYVANPGESEHHTGLGIDLNVNREGAISYVESDAECEWFREKCQEYGFILRFPKDKVHMTGISHESWHYRYVGVPHAQRMEDMNFCLEEYIDYLKSYTYDGICLGYDDETGVFDMKAEEFYEAESGVMIYYVPADEGEESTDTLIPKDCTYTVSGNNVDGFIITCTK